MCGSGFGIGHDDCILGNVRARMAQGPDLAAAVVGVKVRAVELGEIVPSAQDATDDAVSSVRMPVLDEWWCPNKPRRNLCGVRPLLRPFVPVPARIRAFRNEVYPFDR